MMPRLFVLCIAVAHHDVVPPDLLVGDDILLRQIFDTPVTLHTTNLRLAQRRGHLIVVVGGDIRGTPRAAGWPLRRVDTQLPPMATGPLVQMPQNQVLRE